tara:strand:+ start:3756 stop:3902 length:147 start_codon:yes stop_codon:yes gene_type:complete
MGSGSLKGMIFDGQRNTRYISPQNARLVEIKRQAFLKMMGRLGIVQVA